MITWYLYKKTGRKIFKDINWPLFYVGTYNVPPATGINYTSWALVNWIFNGYIKQRAFAWWSKYNVSFPALKLGFLRKYADEIQYVLAAAIDTGRAIAGIIIFFAVSYPGYSMPDWWGNTVYADTLDAVGVPYLPMPESGFFGPANGTWS